MTGVVLVCWEHELIAGELLPGLLGGQRLPGIPATWPSDRYDVVLRLDRATAGAPWSFRQLFPRVLAGNSDTSL